MEVVGSTLATLATLDTLATKWTITLACRWHMEVTALKGEWEVTVTVTVTVTIRTPWTTADTADTGMDEGGGSRVISITATKNKHHLVLQRTGWGGGGAGNHLECRPDRRLECMGLAWAISFIRHRQAPLARARQAIHRPRGEAGKEKKGTCAGGGMGPTVEGHSEVLVARRRRCLSHHHHTMLHTVTLHTAIHHTANSLTTVPAEGSYNNNNINNNIRRRSSSSIHIWAGSTIQVIIWWICRIRWRTWSGRRCRFAQTKACVLVCG